MLKTQSREDVRVDSILWEVEYDWFGQWKGQLRPAETLVFDASWQTESKAWQTESKAWQTESKAYVTAKVEFDGNKQFTRSGSTDWNDGHYYITERKLIDNLRDVYLVGGWRRLRSGIPGAWYGIWWRQWEKRHLDIETPYVEKPLDEEPTK